MTTQLYHTVQEMIELLEEYPLDEKVKDGYGSGYSVREVISPTSIPILVMSRTIPSHPDGDTVLKFLSILIDISMDERFWGNNTKVFHKGDYCNASQNFVLMKASPPWSQGPLIRMK